MNKNLILLLVIASAFHIRVDAAVGHAGLDACLDNQKTCNAQCGTGNRPCSQACKSEVDACLNGGWLKLPQFAAQGGVLATQVTPYVAPAERFDSSQRQAQYDRCESITNQCRSRCDNQRCRFACSDESLRCIDSVSAGNGATSPESYSANQSSSRQSGVQSAASTIWNAAVQAENQRRQARSSGTRSTTTSAASGYAPPLTATPTPSIKQSSNSGDSGGTNQNSGRPTYAPYTNCAKIVRKTKTTAERLYNQCDQPLGFWWRDADLNGGADFNSMSEIAPGNFHPYAGNVQEVIACRKGDLFNKRSRVCEDY